MLLVLEFCIFAQFTERIDTWLKFMDSSLITAYCRCIRSIGFPELKLLRPFEVSLSRFRAGETIDGHRYRK